MGAQHSKKKKSTGQKRKQDHDWTLFSAKNRKVIFLHQNLPISVEKRRVQKGFYFEKTHFMIKIGDFPKYVHEFWQKYTILYRKKKIFDQKRTSFDQKRQFSIKMANFQQS